MKQKLLAIALTIIASTSFYACNKSSMGDNTSLVTIHITDDPSSYEHVYLDIQQVEITMSERSPITFSVSRPGIYDILKFKNGLDTILVRLGLLPGTMTGVRLILGGNNSVVVNGIQYPLAAAPAAVNGVTGKNSVAMTVNEIYTTGNAYDLWLDIDAGKSVVQTGEGEYYLKPTVRMYDSKTRAGVRGYAIPLNSMITIYAIRGIDTAIAIPNTTDNFFEINGLAPGTYTILIQPSSNDYLPYIRTNVPVPYGEPINLQAITLQKR